MAENIDPQFVVQRIYLKDASFETPQGAKVFTQKCEPKVNLDVNTRTQRLDEEHHEVVLRVTVTATGQDDKTLLLIEVNQAGIFLCRGLTNDQLRQVLSTRAPEILFPYVREAVDSLAVRGSFPPFMLAPINFDALYQQAIAQAQQNQQTH